MQYVRENFLITGLFRILTYSILCFGKILQGFLEEAKCIINNTYAHLFIENRPRARYYYSIFRNDKEGL